MNIIQPKISEMLGCGRLFVVAGVLVYFNEMVIIFTMYFTETKE